MIFVNAEYTNILKYDSRYKSINYYEVLDHDSRLVSSGTCNLSSTNGEFIHYLYYYFINNNLYTYKSYSLVGTEYKLATQQLLSTYTTDYRLDDFKEIVKPISTFKEKDNLTTTGYTNSMIYYSRYNNIDKYEILDHNSRVIYSGLCTLQSAFGQIIHTGITINMKNCDMYSYKSYSLISGVYKLATHQFIKNTLVDKREMNYKTITKNTNLFKNIKSKTLSIIVIDGGNAFFVDTFEIDGGNSVYQGSEVVDGNYL